MSPDELKRVLESSGIPFTYHHWEAKRKPPYGVYLYVYDSQFYADNELYYWTGHYQVELYTGQKDQEAEANIESALSAAGIPYEKSETHLESEQLYETLYEIEV